ncbi:MAG: hypothetical protein JNL36_07975 [Candidatus Kapabacteria bacterium]|nr:hypothetical protein [Candidatus Kapabacteria bacterium]
MKLRLHIFIAILFGIFHNVALAQPQVAYMIPDVGTPNFATYVEFIAPVGANNTFGSDGLNMTTSTIGIRTLNPADTSKVVIGPASVSWDGRVISAHVFVKPTVKPNSTMWQNLQQQFVVPLVVTRAGQQSAPQNFYILIPTDLFSANLISERVLGAGLLGQRSPRGAMIIENANFAPDVYTVNTGDCDPNTPGNQGFLPFTLLCTGTLNAVGTTINVSGQAINGGPGGGGGGGRFCDFGVFGTSCPGDVGGSGYTGGGGGGKNQTGSNTFQNGGVGTGVVNSTAQFGSSSLNGVQGGVTTGYESSGGGTGHPFGTSGEGCNDGAACDMNGGFGGGSGNRQNESGGAGGNVENGPGHRNSGGKAHGNSYIVPLSGGSGGASGNPQGNGLNWASSGNGGGGGGAISVHTFELIGLNINANGGDGGASSNGRGGGGSGGNVIVGSRISNTSNNISVVGGAGEFKGASGRFRRDGPAGAVVTTDNQALSANFGVWTDSTRFTQTRNITLSGINTGLISIYMSHQSQPDFVLVATVNANGVWQAPITLPGNDSIYYFSTCLSTTGVVLDPHAAVPQDIFSQSSWNIIRLLPNTELSTISDRQVIFAPPCDTVSKLDTMYIKNIGGANLIIQSILFDKNSRFTVVSPLNGVVIPGDSIRVIVRITQPNVLFDPLTDTDSLRIISNDPKFAGGSYAMYYEVIDESFQIATSGFHDFGNVTITQMSSTTLTITNNGKSPITIRSLSHAFPVFVVSPVSPFAAFPLTLNPGETETFDARFTPTGTPMVYNDTIRFVVDNAYCSTVVAIPIRGTGVNPVRASLKLPIIVDADPSLNNYRIPVRLTVQNISNFATQTDSLFLRVSADASLFFPQSITNGTLRSIERVGNKRIVDFVITGLVIRDQVDAVITEIVGNILLGRNEVTPLLFESVQWTGVGLDSIIDGQLDISICQAGGDRLLMGSTVLATMIHPNPTSSNVSMEVTPREVGTHTITIYDVTGSAITTPVEFEPMLLQSGMSKFKLTIDLSKYSNGVYRIVVQTPTEVVSYPLHIIR